MIEIITVCGCSILLELEQLERVPRGVYWRVSRPKGQKPYIVSCGRPGGSLLYLHRLLFDYDTTRWRLVHRNGNYFDFRPANIAFEPGGTHKLRRPEHRSLFLHGCELRPSFEGSRCAPGWRCPRYWDCMNKIADETEWIGWQAEGENCQRYYRPSEINRERALRIMRRLWKALFDKQRISGTISPRTTV